MIGLPTSTYYRRPRPVAGLEQIDPDAELRAAIQTIQHVFPAYGYRRVTRELRRRQHHVNHKRVQRVMQAMLAPPTPRRRPRVVAEPATVRGAWSPTLRTGVVPTSPNQLWDSDWPGARRAFAVSRPRGAAIETRCPPPECIHHSNRGSQYASRRYRVLLHEAGLRGSVSRSGNPYGNAHAESFMKTLKHEKLYLRPYRSIADVIANLPHYLDFIYNNRLRSAIGYQTPSEYEEGYTSSQSTGQIV